MAKQKDPRQANAIPLPPMPEVEVSKGNAIDLPPLPDVGVVSGGGASDGTESVKDLLREVIRLLEDIRNNTEDIGGGESLG